MLTELQKRAAQAIVNIFETSEPRGDYGRVTVLKGDNGHLTYGRSQTTLSSGNLYLLLKAYCEEQDAQYADGLKYYLPRLLQRDTRLDHDTTLHTLLQSAGDDPVMQDVQDQFFDRAYWDPSVRAAEELGLDSVLGIAVVYDSKIHGSWRTIRDKTLEQYGEAEDIGESTWIESYLHVRRAWLANHRIPILRKTVYRMDAFFILIQQSNWDLSFPFYVRGIRVDEGAVAPTLPRASAQESGLRLLYLQSPFLRGDDVKEIQDALLRDGYSIKADGIFGRNTEKAIKEFQTKHGLKADGIIGPVTLAFMKLT